MTIIEIAMLEWNQSMAHHMIWSLQFLAILPILAIVDFCFIILNVNFSFGILDASILKLYEAKQPEAKLNFQIWSERLQIIHYFYDFLAVSHCKEENKLEKDNIG